MADGRDYVNDLPAGYPPETGRCQHRFTDPFTFGVNEVQGRLCGLPVANDATGCQEQRCYFHSTRARDRDAALKGLLEKAVKSGAYLGEALLENACLGRRACLRNALLPYAKLGGAELPAADLHNARLDEADLTGACLEWTNLLGAQLTGATLRDADLRDARLETLWIDAPGWHQSRPGTPRLDEAKLQGALLTRAIIAPEADLSGAKIECPLRDELDADTAKDFSACEAVYRQLKLNFQESGDYRRAGEFYLREMFCRWMHRVREGRLGAALTDILIYCTCGHGERPLWAFIWSVLVVVAFAFFQGWLGIKDDQGDAVVGPGCAAPSVAGLKAFGTALYFSVVTFTTLGYVDLAPAHGLGRTLVGIEAALGFVLMSVLMVCIARKFSR